MADLPVIDVLPQSRTLTVGAEIACDIEEPKRKRSKSRISKRDREPQKVHEDKILVPDPRDGYQLGRYIDQRVAMGDFRGSPAGTVGLLQYYVRHTARDTSRLGNGESEGWVLTGKSRVAKIAAENDLSDKTVRRINTWLAEHGWLYQETENDPTAVGGKRMHLFPMMRPGDHDARLKAASQVEGGSGLTDRSVRSHRPESADSQTEVSGPGDLTIQGDIPGPNEDRCSESAAKDQEQEPTQPLGDCLAGTSPGPSVEELRADFLGYLREHATSPDSALRPLAVWADLGIDGCTANAVTVEIIGWLRAEGLIRPCEGGWYAADTKEAMK